MPIAPDITHIRRYPHHPLLGRHLVLDRRSLAHTVPLVPTARLRTASWLPKTPILDQSNLTAQGIDTSLVVPGADTADALGSCTGNASAYALSSLLDAEGLAAAGLATDDAAAAERFAIRWYAAATRTDQWNDAAWPTTDCGSSGLGTSKAGRARGWFTGYRTATSAHGLLSALQSGAVILGMPWHSAFFEPDAQGFIDVGNWQASDVAGGHEVCGAALEKVAWTRAGSIDAARTVLALPNSWGTSWGDSGYFRMRLSTYQTLRSQIDVYQFRLPEVA
jgi:hypothetical protein